MRIYLRTIMLLISTLIYGGEYGDAFIIASTPSNIRALNFSNGASIIDMGASFINPAGQSGKYLHLSYNHQSSLFTNIILESGIALEQGYSLGATLIHAGYGDINFRPDLSQLTPLERRDSIRISTNDTWGTFTAREEALFLTLSKNYSTVFDLGWRFFKIPTTIPMGINMKIINKQIDENIAYGIGLDLGSQLKLDLSDVGFMTHNTNLNLGLVVRDILNTPIYWTSMHQDAILRHTAFYVGTEKRIPAIKSNINLYMSYNHNGKKLKQYGFEYSFADKISLMVGLGSIEKNLGFKISWKRSKLFYSISMLDYANNNNISYSYNF